MLHATSYMTGGDIDKCNESPFRRTNQLYHAKRRFPSIQVNMHYQKNFDAVGTSTGNKELDNMRFRTWNRDEHSTQKIQDRNRANPRTVFEDMAMQSRRCMAMQPPRDPARTTLSSREALIPRTTLGNAVRPLESDRKATDRRNTVSNLLQKEREELLGRSAGAIDKLKKKSTPQKTTRAHSITDVHLTRDKVDR